MEFLLEVVVLTVVDVTTYLVQGNSCQCKLQAIALPDYVDTLSCVVKITGTS